MQSVASGEVNVPSVPAFPLGKTQRTQWRGSCFEVSQIMKWWALEDDLRTWAVAAQNKGEEDWRVAAIRRVGDGERPVCPRIYRDFGAHGLRAQGRLHAAPPELDFGLGRGSGPHTASALLNSGQRGRRRAKGLFLIWFPYSNVRSPLG